MAKTSILTNKLETAEVYPADEPAMWYWKN